MRHSFPLFQSHIDLAHGYWQQLLQPEDWAIDATCGNGNDTLVLAGILQGHVIGMDIQKEAIETTRALLQSHLSPVQFSNVHLFHGSHVHFPAVAKESPIKLVVYNLGYLPRGDKALTTLTHSTLESVQSALRLIVPGGAVSITCYPGHAEGANEERALIEMLNQLPAIDWNVCMHSFLNRKAAPSLIFIQKKCEV